MNKIKGVILDLDNTLYGYNHPNKQGHEAILAHAEEKLGISSKEIHDAISRAREKNHETIPTHGASHSRLLYFQKALERLTGRTNFKLTLEMEELFWDTFMNHMKLYDDAMDFLEHLKKKNKKVLILTDLTAQVQKKKIIKLGIQDHVDYLVSSEEAGAEKPDPKVFELSLEKLGLKKDEVVMIGDNYEKDIMGAKRFGINKAYHKVDEKLEADEDQDVIKFKIFSEIKEDF